MEIPTFPPTSFRTGETVKWTTSDPDHLPTASWVLTFEASSQTSVISGTGTNNGDGSFLVTLTASATGTASTGDYFWTERVSKGTGTALERYTVRSGWMEILPSMGTAIDARSHARKMLDAIELVLEGKAPQDVASYSVAGRSLQRLTYEELLVARDRYRSEVAREVTAERIAMGLGSRRTVFTRLK